MPRFEIVTPEGQRFEITAPEGATEEQALEFARTQTSGKQLTTEKPTPIQELSKGFVDRSTFEAVGGMGGAVLGGGAGLLTGPAAPAAIPTGAIAGGALGSAAGSLTYDQVNNILLSLGIGSGEHAGIETNLTDAAVSGGSDLVFSMAAASFGPAFNLLRAGRPVVGRILGVSNEKAAELANRARQMGIDLGIVDVSERAFVKGAPGVLGVIPVVGAPLRRHTARKGAQLEDTGENIINEIAPIGLISDLGVDLTKAAEKSHSASRDKITGAWNVFRESAAKLSVPDVFPTSNVRKFAQELEEESFKARITLPDQQVIGGEKATNKELADYVTLLKNLPELLTIDQVRGISKRLNQLADTATTQQAGGDLRLIGELKRLVQADLQNIDISKLPKPEADEIVSLLGVANRLTATELSKFETATAKKLGTFDKHIFGVGPFKAGAKEADQLAKTLTKLDSPIAVENLRTVVGDEVMNRLARGRVEGAWNEAHEVVGGQKERIFNPFSFEKALGLDGKATKELNTETLDALLKTTGTSVQQLQEFIDVAKTAYMTEVADASKFVARRFILTAGGASAGVTAGAIAALGLSQGLSISTIGLAVLGRYGAKYLADPDKLRLMSRVLDDTQTDKLRRMALARLLRTSTDDE